jgi:hypothetical protein
VFRVLLEAAASAAPRSAVFLVRQGQLRGWGSSGYDRDAAARQRAFVVTPGDDSLGQLLADAHAGLTPCAGGLDGLEFGQPEASESVAIPIRVKDKPIALVLIERDGAEEPWTPHAVAALATVARLRLELDLALRKLSPANESEASATRSESAPTAAGQAVPRGAPPASGPLAARAAAVAERLAPQDVAAAVAVAPAPAVEAPDADALDARLTAARRYARLVATDIRLYNEETVVLGRRHGDLATRLEDALLRGRETWLKRHGDLGPAGLNMLREAYVSVLANGDATLIPSRIFE